MGKTMGDAQVATGGWLMYQLAENWRLLSNQDDPRGISAEHKNQPMRRLLHSSCGIVPWDHEQYAGP